MLNIFEQLNLQNFFSDCSTSRKISRIQELRFLEILQMKNISHFKQRNHENTILENPKKKLVFLFVQKVNFLNALCQQSFSWIKSNRRLYAS